MGTLAEKKWNEFKGELKDYIRNSLEYKGIDVLENQFTQIFEEVMSEIEYGSGTDIVGDYIADNWFDFDWDDESDENNAEYYHAYIEALKEGLFDDIIEEKIGKVLNEVS